MQVAGSAYPASQPLYPYPNHYHHHHHHHHPIPVAHDHELKRQYLTLLPPQQIIEICLTFDVHVPPYVKASIWPIDISAAIAGLRKQLATSSSSAQSQDGGGSTKSPQKATEEGFADRGNGEGAIMGSLTAGSREPTPAPDQDQAKSKESVDEPRPPDKEVATEEGTGENTDTSASISSAASTAETPSTTETETSSTSTTSSASTSTPTLAGESPAPGVSAATTTPPAATPAVAPVAQPLPVAYPHQPYGYPYAPYYPPPPGYPYPHPHHQYPYPHQHQHAYPPPQPPTTMPPVPPPPAPPLAIMQEGQSADDLPSYEEMIVEALIDSNDPEGCAPKDLFTWMAARYPVQSNFRPSASQALQKAYKRGRLEKSINNKYRLNSAWEGGNTSRRTTRRPQTHAHTLTSSNTQPSSPFTNAPLVHHHQKQQNRAPQQHHSPYPYASYPYPQGAYTSYARQPSAVTTTAATAQATGQPTPAAHAPATAPKSPDTSPVQDKDANDAYEAAQNILKAINFGSLLQLPAEETQEGVAARGIALANASQGQAGTAGYQRSTTVAAPQTLSATLNGAQSTATPPISVPANVGAQQSNSRADLQAQLALLAAQLAELARVDESHSVSKPAEEVPGALQQAQAHTQTQSMQAVSPVIRQHTSQPQQSQQHQYFQQPPASVVAQQPMYNSPYPYPHLQQRFQIQPQAPPPVQAQTTAQPSLFDKTAPMASLLPPPPPAPVPEPGPQPQTQWSPSLMQIIQSQTTSEQVHQPTQAVQQGREVAPAPSPLTAPPPPAPPTKEQVNAKGSGDTHERHVSSDGLGPLEFMDTGLDAEYESDDDDDDDMEEVV